MNYILQRYSDDGDSTLGLFFSKTSSSLLFQNYTLEDEHREVKVMHETCIPAGLYELKFREVVSPKTSKYRAKYSWFNWHIQVQDVEGFENIYIHIGNTDDHTSGCILLADKANNNQVEDGFIGSSTTAFKRFYEEFSSLVLNGEKVFLEVRDLKYIH